MKRSLIDWIKCDDSGAKRLFVVMWNGMQFVAYADKASDPEEQARLDGEAKESIRRMAEDFLFYGCGGEAHRFNGDPAELPALECTNCGAVKPEGCIYKPEYWRNSSPSADMIAQFYAKRA